jgi:oligopeptide/dipeptide ABC transporter ATP-binding protein
MRFCTEVHEAYCGIDLHARTMYICIFNRPSHPYTQALLASVPKMEERVEWLASIEGQPPALNDLPAGCRFAFQPRCPFGMPECSQIEPVLKDVAAGHRVACHLYA